MKEPPDGSFFPFGECKESQSLDSIIKPDGEPPDFNSCPFGGSEVKHLSDRSIHSHTRVDLPPKKESPLEDLPPQMSTQHDDEEIVVRWGPYGAIQTNLNRKAESIAEKRRNLSKSKGLKQANDLLGKSSDLHENEFSTSSREGKSGSLEKQKGESCLSTSSPVCCKI